jgi:serine/threonine protein kinase
MSMSTLPRAVGPLTLLRKIETDTIAEVFQGTLDTLDGRPVLVRRMLPHVLRDPARVRAIESRARDLMKVNDERLARTFHWVVEGTDRYLVEDMPAGVGLDQLIASCRFAGRLVPAEAFLTIAYRICDALQALHAYGAADGGPLLHMGLSPSSIALHPGGRATLGLYALTRAGGAVDVTSTTPDYRSQYMSPEQTHPDRPLAPASDIFSTGAILYELLLLQPLWSGENSVETVHAIRRGEHGAQLAAAADRVPAIDAVLARALAPDPNARYRDAMALRDDIRILLGGTTGDADALEDFLAPLFAGIAERARPSTLVPFTEEDSDRTAGEALVSWSEQKDDDDTLVRDRPADPAGYSREFARAVDPTDAPDLFDDPTGELQLDSTDSDVEGGDTQFYRIPSTPPPVADVPEPPTTAPPPLSSPPPDEPPPLWTEESSAPSRSPLRIAGWIGVAAAVLVCAAIGFGATKTLFAKKPVPEEAAVAARPVPPVVAPPVVAAPAVAPAVVAPPAETAPPVVASEPRQPPHETEPVHSAPPTREPRVVAEAEPPAEEREPPRVEMRAPVVAAVPEPEPEEPPAHATEPPPVSDDDLFAELSPSQKAPEPVAYSHLDMDGMKPSARDGALTSADVIALEGVTATDPAYTRSRALLLMNAQKGNDSKAVKRYLDDLMRLPENRYDPVFLTELARYYVDAGKYQQAVDTAKTAEQHWARLPSELVFSKKAEMYEIQARGYTGIFFQSQSVDALDLAIRSWEKYREHVATRSSEDLVAMADKELTKLRTYRERMQ